MYKTCMREISKEFEEKKSLFIGNIKRIYTEDEGKNFLEKIRKNHPEASHNCWAYILGEKKLKKRYSDDGEPQGTAGIPILECINKKDITDVIVVVTRYFGGVLLGAGGLVRAYTKACSLAIEESGIVEVVPGVLVNLIISYDLLGKFQHSFLEDKIHIEDTIYADKVTIKCLIEICKIDSLKKTVANLSNGKCDMIFEEEKKYFKLENRLFENIG